MATTTRVLSASVNGTVYTTNANGALEAIDTCHSGATAPTNEVANGKFWLDTTTTPGILKMYNNAAWEEIGGSTSSPTFAGLTVNGIIETTGGTDIDMDATASGQLKLDGNGYGGAIALNAQGMNIYTNSASRDVIFGTNEIERVRIDGSGNVGIGTATPDTLMELAGANPVLTIRDTDTGTATNDARLRLAESGASDSLDNYFDVGYVSDTFTIGSNTVADALTIDRATGNVGVGSVTAASLVVNGNNYPSAGALSNRNVIINGAMNVKQRGNRAAAAFSSRFYAGPDRWLVNRSGTGSTGFSQIASTAYGGTKAAQATFNAAAGETYVVTQRIESGNIAHLAGQTVTLSFWLSGSSDAGSSSLNAVLSYATVVDDFAAETTISTNAISYSGTAAYYTYTFTLPANAANGVAVKIEGAKTDATGIFTLTFGGVQLEAGTVATPFEHRSYAQELTACQRYYEVDNPSTPTSFGGSMRAQVYHPTNTSGSPLSRDGNFQSYKVDKRANAAVTTYSYNGTSGAVSIITGGGTDTNVMIKAGITGFQVSSSTYRALHAWFAWAADAEL